MVATTPNDDDSPSASSDWRNRMKQFYDEAMDSVGKRPCESARADLRACLLASDCHQVHKRSLQECIKCNDGSVPPDCLALRQTFFVCKRSLLDNRQRFRGRKDY
ncbi:unnamed protein product [Allacma fusca]|uniref:Cytochrome c oxidase assembly factor 5 n=1 Tax=Allacma fusca TaxID=39272 RepID=A0A8J2K5U0_9HEXA|nr:unnamed protein product [Allacma fusca]